MFIDASAIVAVLTREPEADALVDTLEGARAPITSPLAIFEATLAICRKRHASVAEGQADVFEFLEITGIRTVDITVTWLLLPVWTMYLLIWELEIQKAIPVSCLECRPKGTSESLIAELTIVARQEMLSRCQSLSPGL